MASVGWLEGDRLVIRTSSQTPFLTRNELCRVLGLPRERVRVFTGRVGGGFGAKQEMFTEDIVALAVAAHRAAGAIGIHPRRAVHRRVHPAFDGDHRARRVRRGEAGSPR